MSFSVGDYVESIYSGITVKITSTPVFYGHKKRAVFGGNVVINSKGSLIYAGSFCSRWRVDSFKNVNYKCSPLYKAIIKESDEI